jgi:hypothetical protein
MATIDPFTDKAYTISLIDCNATFICAHTLFEQRKEASRVYVIGKDPEVKKLIEVLDSRIREAFLLDDIDKKITEIPANDKTSLQELTENFLKGKNENIPIGGNIEKYLVDCCNEDCGWAGYSTECVCFKHDRDKLFCPECHEVAEPVQ